MSSFCFRQHFWLRRTGRTSWSLCLKVRRWWRKTAWRTFGSSWWTFPPLWTPFMTCTPWWMLSWTTRCDGFVSRCLSQVRQHSTGNKQYSKFNATLHFIICIVHFCLCGERIFCLGMDHAGKKNKKTTTWSALTYGISEQRDAELPVMIWDYRVTRRVAVLRRISDWFDESSYWFDKKFMLLEIERKSQTLEFFFLESSYMVDYIQDTW